MKIKDFFILFTFATTLSFTGLACAETLTVGNVSAAPGETGVLVPITIDTPGNTAGASFTITFDDSVLTLTGISSIFFDTFTHQNIEHSTNLPANVVVDGTTYDQPLILATGPGGAMVAAARISDGATVTTMFILEFSVSGVATPNDYPIGIVASNINNTDAGYLQGGEYIPMLIGYNQGSNPEYPIITPAIVPGIFTVTSGFTDTDGDGIDDSWEMTHFGNLTTANASTDYDNDGYTDRQEYLNRNDTDPQGGAYNPKVTNAPGGTGYIPPTSGTSILPVIYMLLLNN